jgi:hypothetical protein
MKKIGGSGFFLGEMPKSILFKYNPFLFLRRGRSASGGTFAVPSMVVSRSSQTAAAILHLEDAHPTIQPSNTTNNPKPVGRSSHLQEVPFKFRDIIQEFQLTVFVCTVRLYFRRARMKWTPPPAGCKILQLVVELDTVRREEDTYQTM